MKNNKDFDFDISANEKIELGLLNNHVHFLTGEIDEDNIEDAIKWIVYENLSGTNKLLTLYINSDGGVLTDALALIDVMRSSQHPIRTIGLGSVVSAAFLIFTSGTKGQRLIYPNTSIMCHQYSAEIAGKHHDIKSHFTESELMNTRMVSVLQKNSEMDVRTIKNKLLGATDAWLTPAQLIEFGLADKLLT
jgi:ATP-dependent Clp protease protease subunit